MSVTEKPGFRFPSAFTILFGLIILVAALTWIIPAGQYRRIPSEALGKDVPVAGSYAPTDANRQGVFDVILAPIAGFYDPVAYTANATDVSLFVLIIGGFPELEAEMRTWEKRPGPFLLQESGKNAGKPVTTNQMWKIFDKAREAHPELEGAVWHGLRANAVIRLRQHGYPGQQISDMVGMSVEMIERYSRYADRKAGGQAVLRDLQERKQDKTVKHWKTVK